MTPEGKVKKEIKDYLKSIGAYYFMPVQAGYGAPSLDILCCVNGWFVAIEVKAPGNEPTPRQFATMKAINAADGLAFWATSAAHVEKALADILKEPRLGRVLK